MAHDVMPLAYRLRIETKKQFKYDGDVEIDARATRDARRIVMDSVGLDVKSVEVKSGKGTEKAKFKIDKNAGKLIIYWNAAQGKDFTISIGFSGENGDKLSGFYRSKYTANGKGGYILTTQFESSDARSAFPCFDDPSLKAKFDLTLVIDKNLSAVSNMPIRSESMEKGRKVVRFVETPRMSTYLLYMGVGKFDSVGGNPGKVKFRVLTTPGKSHLGSMALEFAKKFVSFYEDYFGIRYPLPKLDLIAIPDFAAGAMENWGAITFRETALLGEEGKVPVATMQNIAETVAHELAHQWFGDLVTMKWWDDLWLNESFATFMAYKAMDFAFPEWRIMDDYTIDVINTALVADSLSATHPISAEVKNPEEIESLFDEISYEKGGSVLYMLEDYVGKEAFRAGLHLYLEKHSYSNATKYDLWNAIQESAKAGTNVSEFTQYWIDNSGYPIVHVERNNGYALRQERFSISGEGKKGAWPLPIHLFGSASGEKTVFMPRERLRLAADDTWIKLNYGQKGFYKVAYHGDLLKRIGEAVRNGGIKGIDTWGVENDLFTLARSSRIKASEYLDFVRDYLAGIDAYALNISTISHLLWIRFMLRGTEKEREVGKAVMDYCAPIYKRLGLVPRSGESTNDKILRSSAISAMGIAGSNEIKEWAIGMFGKKEVDPDLRSTIYSLSARYGGAKEYDWFMEKYKKEQMPDERIRLLGALGSFRDKSLLGKALSFSLSRDVRTQDSYRIPAHVSSNEEGVDLIWKWMQGNWKRLMQIYSPSTHLLGRTVELLSNMNTEDGEKDARAFFSKKGNTREDIDAALKKTLEKIKANVKFVKANSRIWRKSSAIARSDSRRGRNTEKNEPLRQESFISMGPE